MRAVYAVLLEPRAGPEGSFESADARPESTGDLIGAAAVLGSVPAAEEFSSNGGNLVERDRPGGRASGSALVRDRARALFSSRAQGWARVCSGSVSDNDPCLCGARTNEVRSSRVTYEGSTDLTGDITPTSSVRVQIFAPSCRPKVPDGLRRLNDANRACGRRYHATAASSGTT